MPGPAKVCNYPKKLEILNVNVAKVCNYPKTPKKLNISEVLAQLCQVLLPRLVRYWVFVFLTVAHFGRIDNENFKFFGTVAHFGSCRHGNGNKFRTVTHVRKQPASHSQTHPDSEP